jgi:hypothetical protein
MFNFKISRARRVIERVFGQLKKLFALLERPCEQKPAFKTAQVWCCVILYNMLIRKRVLTLTGDEEDEDEEVPVNPSMAQPEENDEYDALQRGLERRDQLVLESYVLM